MTPLPQLDDERRHAVKAAQEEPEEGDEERQVSDRNSWSCTGRTNPWTPSGIVLLVSTRRKHVELKPNFWSEGLQAHQHSSAPWIFDKNQTKTRHASDPGSKLQGPCEPMGLD